MVFTSPLELSTLNGTNGFVLNGVDAFDYSGFSVSGAGDINGDGIDDLIIGAIIADPNGRDNAGESYVVFGNAGGFNASLELSELNGNNGFVIAGVNQGDRSGLSVSDAGDVNGDGIDDLIIGADNADPNNNNNAGSSYVVFGSANGFTNQVDLSTLNGNNGFVIEGVNSNDLSGSSVSSAGDVNGDGIDDVIIGARNADPNNNSNAGASYVVFGSANGFNPNVELSALDGNNGFVIAGVNQGDLSGFSVSSAGDVNGDGIDDLIIGARNADPNNNSNAGESYVVFGSANGFNNQLDLSTLNGNNGFVIEGVNSGDLSGSSVSSAGDVNGDGIDDLIIGINSSDPNNNRGQSFVVFGNANGFAADFELANLNGTNGFAISGVEAGGNSDISVSSAGDLNGDGIDDLIIGVSAAAPNGVNNAGQSFIVFGNANGFAADFELNSLNGTNGFVVNGINANDFAGLSVSGAGDLNGDGVDDLIIGSDNADPNNNTSAGQSYVVFGVRTTPEELEIIGNTPGEVTNISIAENTSVVTDVDSTTEGTGNVTYSILTPANGSAAEDSAFFTIDPNTGILSFLNAPDFENPLDQGGDNVYQVDVVATSGTQSVVQFIDVAVTNDISDDAPETLEIIGNTPGEVLNISISENTSVVTDVNSTTETIGDVTYSILSVADGSFAEDLEVFTIDPNTGVLSFINPPDFENPLDQGGNNVYQVDVLATSGTQSAVQFIDVTVTNDPADDLAILGNTPGQVTNISVSENNSLVVDVEVNVTGNLTYRILGVQDQSFAEDADLFTIDPNTGLLSFINPPDFENPLDQGGDNVYQVDIEVAFAGNTATQLIDVTVLDVPENRLLTSALRFNPVPVDFAAETTYLVTDNNNNELVDDRSELFGGAVGEGFADLASFDSNNDGLINALDLNFADLLVWQDANDNGITDPTELISLAQTGIASVPTDFTDTFNSPALQTNIFDGLVTEDALTESI